MIRFSPMRCDGSGVIVGVHIASAIGRGERVAVRTQKADAPFASLRIMKVGERADTQ